ncbi:MAG TPA: M23 family metallopeptidase [Candidatus Nanoarchaeia archaeon]|nr:M23 family metallopeptidase [Candidatus Nanoarchaeia archaeon]
MENTRRAFFRGVIGSFFSSLVPWKAHARPWLNLQYIKAKGTVALRVPIRRGVSYALFAEIFTGSEANMNEIKNFNDSIALTFDARRQQYISIPRDLLRHVLKKSFDENNFSTFEIDNQGSEGINSLWDVAEGFMVKDVGIDERIKVLLALNDEVNPISMVVYDGQKILVPEFLVDQNNVVVDVPDPSRKKPVKEKVVNKTSDQNPFRCDLADIRGRLRERDQFGTRRARSLGRGRYRITKHTGLDLAAPIGTKVYPIKTGVVLRAGRDRDKWRNGNVVVYRTTSGLEVTYIHLKKVNVKVGQNVTLKSVLGTVGITGNASADNPHVHVQVKKNGVIVNPRPYCVVDT